MGTRAGNEKSIFRLCFLFSKVPQKTCFVPSHEGINVQNHTKRILSLNMSRSAEALKWFPRSEFSPEAFFACFLDCPPTPENNGTLNTTGLLRDFEARPAKTWPRNEE